MRKLRPLLVALPIVLGILIGVGIGTGSGQGTAPPRSAVPDDAVQQAQTPQAVPATRPEQRKTQYDQQDFGKNAPSAAASEAQPDQGQGLGFDRQGPSDPRFDPRALAGSAFGSNPRMTHAIPTAAIPLAVVSLDEEIGLLTCRVASVLGRSALGAGPFTPGPG
jgi:hypothetical protein